MTAVIDVGFERNPARRFDLVVGADGLHSTVRKLTFGPESRFERDIGYWVAAFEMEGYRPRDELVYVSHTAPGRQISRFAERHGRTLFLFVFAAEHMPGARATQRRGAAGDASRNLRRPRLGNTAHSCGHERCSGHLFRSGQPDRDAGVVEGPGGAPGGRCRLRLPAGRRGMRPGADRSLRLGGELARAGGDHVQTFARYEESIEIAARVQAGCAHANSPGPSRPGQPSEFGFATR